MNTKKKFVLILLLMGLSSSLKAQLSDSFDVISDGKNKPVAGENTAQPISCEAAELLVSKGCSLEAGIMYSALVVQYHSENNTVKLDKACVGLFRAQFLAKLDSKYTENLALCRPEIIDSLYGKINWEPMFVSQPIFKPSEEWLNSATPGVAYKVSMYFDIDEWGNPYNFDFNADDKFLLRYPVIEGLKNARYIPGVKNGKAVKKSKNIVEVVFCLDRGTTCIDEN